MKIHLSRIPEKLNHHWFMRKKDPIETNTPLLHFGYHKCLTLYFKQIYSDFCKVHNLKYIHSHNDNVLESKREQIGKNTICSISNSITTPKDFINSRSIHIIRDPRKIILSSYNYHKWCKEPWATRKMSETIINRFSENISRNIDFSIYESYQHLLNSVDEKSGIIIEMFSRKNAIMHMYNWNYKQQNVLELRFEKIVGNERKYLTDIYRFFELPAEYLGNFLRIGEFYRLKPNRWQLKKNSHLTHKKRSKPEDLFTGEINEYFNSIFPDDLLESLGY